MPTPTPSPGGGYGKQTEASIDHANIAMRSMPWYQEQMRQWGQDPGHPNLAKSQSQQILKQAQANGFVIDEGHMEIDNHGNMNPKGHKLRNTIIVAGLAAGAYFALPAIIAAASTGAPAAATTAGLTGVEAGATAGLGAVALPGAMATLPALGTTAAIGTTAGLGAVALPGAMATLPAATGTTAALAPLASTTIGSGAVPALTGGTTTALTGGGTTAALTGRTIAGLSQSELTRYGLSTAGNLVNGYLQNRAASQAQDKQQKYLDEALAYAKEQDAYSRKYKEGRDAVEASRYGDYSGRIAPYLATGASANDRMASLLGLPSAPARSVTAGPTPASAGPAAAPIATMPTPGAPGQLVTVQAPDGSQKQVPASEAAHWQQRGGTILQGAA